MSFCDWQKHENSSYFNAPGGSLNDKSPLPESVEILLQAGFQPRRTVYLAFGHDEGMIIADGIIPGVERPVALIGIAQKGKGSLELSVSGEPAGLSGKYLGDGFSISERITWACSKRARPPIFDTISVGAAEYNLNKTIKDKPR